MRKILGAAVALGLTAALIAPAHARLLRCTVEDAREVVDGTLEPTKISEISIGHEMFFDEAENRLTLPGGISWFFDRIQDGSADNDLVALRVYQGPANAAVMTWRIRVWEPDLPFLFVYGAEVQSGQCKPF